MKKKLKIKFWKAEKALAMQIVEQEGLPEKKMDGFVLIEQSPDFYSEMVELRGVWSHYDFNVVNKRFSENQKRDAYLSKMTQAITDELFTGTGELKVGEMCEVRTIGAYIENWESRKLLAKLPSKYWQRFIVQHPDKEHDWLSYDEARPLPKRTEPKVETNGEIITYTWEEE